MAATRVRVPYGRTILARKRAATTAATLLAFLLLPLAPALSAADSSRVDFEEDIRPIFAEKCTLCHGPDEAKAGLRLTNREEATRTLKSDAVAVVPGDPGASALLERIHSDDPDEVMPPPDEAEPLTAEEKNALRRWIAQGADWPRHWAYKELSDAAPPTVNAKATGGAETQPADTLHPVDAFVRARLAEEGIAPSPEASPRILIRRLSLDLTGLLPPPERVDSFLAAWKKSPDDAWEKLVDELLASPRFGERWGRHWLDKARYADSDGYEKDNHRPDAWRYRDWVIDAINEDLPVDQFTVQQLAGDLLPEAGPVDKLATAFHRQTLTNTEGGTDQEQWRVAAVMDRTETLGTVWLGLTVGCARCHTHKYDAITQREYYQLYAYFNNGDETTASVPENEEAWAAWEQKNAAHQEKIESVRKKQRAALKRARPGQRAWEKQLAARLGGNGGKAPDLKTANLAKVKASSSHPHTKLRRQDDGSYLVSGKSLPTATYTINAELTPGTYTGLSLEALADSSLPSQGPGRNKNGNFVLNRLVATVNGTEIAWATARADHEQDGYPASEALDENARSGKNGSGWAVSPRFGKDHRAEFAFAEDLVVEKTAPVRIQLVQNYGSEHTLGRFRLRAIISPGELILPDPVRTALSKSPDDRSETERRALAEHYLRHAPETRALTAELAALRRSAPDAPAMNARVISERSEDPRETHVFHRGEFKQPGEKVTPATFASLPPIDHRGETGDRLDLARWLVSGENPLPPRVLVNHLWANLFGEGLVPTREDFGVRGDRPTHPALLDWLARHWITELGWSRKKLIRLAVLSDTYRQSSRHRPELADRDPKNQLLARQNRHRVEAEIVRDITLDAAGLLSGKIGGPSVFPPIPDGVADVNYNSRFKWKASEDEDRYRRGLYTYFKRTAPHPTLMTFDCPDSNVTAVSRNRSNTPLSALVTLNNEVYREAALALARRVLNDSPKAKGNAGQADAARLGQAYRICLSRPPRPEESDPLLVLLDKSRDHYRSHPDEAKQLLGELPAASNAETEPPELAAWAATLRVVLNLDEFLTRN